MATSQKETRFILRDQIKALTKIGSFLFRKLHIRLTSGLHLCWMIVCMKDIKELLMVGNIAINNSNRSVVVKDDQNSEHTLKFTQTEFRLLSCLASQPEKVFSREELFSLAWGGDPRVMGRNVDVHICQVRKKLDDKSTHTVKALSGVGYKLTMKRKKLTAV